MVDATHASVPESAPIHAWQILLFSLRSARGIHSSPWLYHPGRLLQSTPCPVAGLHVVPAEGKRHQANNHLGLDSFSLNFTGGPVTAQIEQSVSSYDFGTAVIPNPALSRKLIGSIRSEMWPVGRPLDILKGSSGQSS